MAVSFATNIRPMFTDMDIAHMKNFGVLLDDFGFMRDPANAHKVLNAVSSGAMPPSAPGPAVTTVTTTPNAATAQDSNANHLLVRALKTSTFPACGVELMPPIIQYSEPQH